MVEWSKVQAMVSSNVNRYQTEIMGYRQKLLQINPTMKMGEICPKTLIRLRDLYFPDD
jgi:hypothetical protein